MMIDFSSEAIKERQGNYLFKMPCALNKKKKKERKEKINQPGIRYLKKLSRTKVQMTTITDKQNLRELVALGLNFKKC